MLVAFTIRGMKLLIIALAGVAMAQAQASSPSAQLPIKPGEWKMIAVIHAPDGDAMRSFFSCMTQTDLSHLVPQPANLPKEFSCTQDSQQLTANGENLAFTCKSASSTSSVNYQLTRNSDSLVTGTMKLASDDGGKHAESNTDIVYQWQQKECVNSSSSASQPLHK